MNNNLSHARTSVYNINYHMVWSVKYMRKIITLEIEEFLRETAIKIAEDKGFIVHLFEVGDMNHIHCLYLLQENIHYEYC